MSLSFQDFTSFCEHNTNSLASTFRNASVVRGFKDDGSLVTNLDVEIESDLRQAIRSSYPSHSIVGEELDIENNNSRFSWIIDPIDGTYSFCNGSPLFGTLIGFLENGMPRYGFMRLPLINDTVVFGNNEHTTVSGRPSSIRKFNGWDNSLVLTTDIYTIINSPASHHWQHIIKQGATARTWGDCYGYFMICSGQADLMADTNLKDVDILPIIPILKGSGASLHTFDRRDYKHIITCSTDASIDLNIK